jgi:glc operon protein GlcG
MSADLIPMNSLSLAVAHRILRAAEAKATALGVGACICIVDPSGEAILSARMDNAARMSASIALNKAWTVASFKGIPTHAWWPIIEGEPSLVHGLTQTPRFIVFGGGVPVLVDGELVGAVGVSGGSADEDRAIAEAGVAGLET